MEDVFALCSQRNKKSTLKNVSWHQREKKNALRESKVRAEILAVLQC